MIQDWKHQKTIRDLEKYEINGINIWDSKWEDTGQRVNVKDPLYNQNYTFVIYMIKNSSEDILFLAGEFSNCIWGIYEKENIKAHKETEVQ